MVKHRRKSRKANSAFQALQVDTELALSTLANNTVLAQALTILSDDFWVISGDLNWLMIGMTPGEDPLYVGIANGDLSVAEIKEAINASPVSRSDIVEREQARRPVRKVGAFTQQDAATVAQRLNDGKPIRTKIRMYLAEGTELNMWAHNKSGATLTTGAKLHCYGTLYGVWK